MQHYLEILCGKPTESSDIFVTWNMIFSVPWKAQTYEKHNKNSAAS